MIVYLPTYTRIKIMKKSKILLLAFALLSNLMMFAAGAGPGDDDGSGGLEGTGDPQPASINSKLILLLVVGMIFAFYTIRKQYKKA